MFPRQRLYETYQWDRINYQQIGGNLGKLGDLLKAAGKTIDEIPTATKNALKLNDIPADGLGLASLVARMDNISDTEIDQVVKELTTTGLLKQIADSLDPTSISRFHPKIIQNVPDDKLLQVIKKLSDNQEPYTKLNQVVEGLTDDKLLKVVNDLPPEKMSILKLTREQQTFLTGKIPIEKLKNIKTPELEPPPEIPIKTVTPKKAISNEMIEAEELKALEDPSIEFGPETLEAFTKRNKELLSNASQEGTVALNNLGKASVAKFKNFFTRNKNIAKVDLKATGKAQTLDEAKIQNASFISRNKKTIIATSVVVLVAGGLIAYGGVALDNFIKKNDAPFKIVGMEFDKTDPDTSIWIMYEVTTATKFELTADNWILLKEHDSVPMLPPIERIYKIAEVDNAARKLRILIQKNEKPTTTLGKTGKFLYQTTYDQQLLETASDLGKTLTAVPAAVAGGVFGGILEGLGLTKQTFLIGAGVFIGLIFILLIVYMVMSSKSK
jgi:hypothetical protein